MMARKKKVSNILLGARCISNLCYLVYSAALIGIGALADELPTGAPSALASSGESAQFRAEVRFAGGTRQGCFKRLQFTLLQLGSGCPRNNKAEYQEHKTEVVNLQGGEEVLTKTPRISSEKAKSRAIIFKKNRPS
jgi:hypothetical protein